MFFPEVSFLPQQQYDINNHIVSGVNITTEKGLAETVVFKDEDEITPKNLTLRIEPDTHLEENDLSIFFYYWHNRIPQWKVSGQAVMNLENMDFSLYNIWIQAISQIQFNIDINRLKKGQCFKFDIEYHINQNIPARWRKYYISICHGCKKSVIIHLSRPIIYCPNCARIKDANEQRLRRAIKQGRKLCKYCGKPLPKEYPNRDYCPGGSCKNKEYRLRKKRNILANDMTKFEENDFKVG